MAAEPGIDGETALLHRIRELEEQLQESEETLGAIRRGEVDALVVRGPEIGHQVYTLEGPDRPYRVLIEQMQEGALTVSANGTILYCNRRFAQLVGADQDSLVGRPLCACVTPDEERERLQHLLAGARFEGGRGEFVFASGSAAGVPAYLSLSPLRGEDDTTILCGVLTDLSEQKGYMAELAGANSRLTDEIAERERVEDALRQSQKMEAVGQLTGGLAHDFNNLLTGIVGSLELLQTRILQGRFQGVDRYVSAAQDAAQRAAALTHRLLAFARRQTLAPKSTDAGHLIRGMEDLIRRTIGPENDLATEAEDDLWHILVDPGQLENALLNLCINARDAMPDGGSIRMRARNLRLDAGTARKLELPPGSYVVIGVSDEGTGMPPDVAARAFDPFFTTKPLGMGTGLGLSMIYGFVRQSGGQVQIVSKVGSGTTVTLYLPRHEGATAADEQSPGLAQAPRSPSAETVLIVDDEPTIRMLIAEVLDELGYTTIEAVDGAAGLQLLQSDTRIDLLVTDVGLPGGLNGRQMADAGRTLRPTLRVLFITGYAESASLNREPLPKGMDVLTKPFMLDTLAAHIRRMIDSA